MAAATAAATQPLPPPAPRPARASPTQHADRSRTRSCSHGCCMRFSTMQPPTISSTSWLGIHPVSPSRSTTARHSPSRSCPATSRRHVTRVLSGNSICGATFACMVVVPHRNVVLIAIHALFVAIQVFVPIWYDARSRARTKRSIAAATEETRRNVNRFLPPPTSTIMVIRNHRSPSFVEVIPLGMKDHRRRRLLPPVALLPPLYFPTQSLHRGSNPGQQQRCRKGMTNHRPRHHRPHFLIFRGNPSWHPSRPAIRLHQQYQRLWMT
mmetsp:Transcript_4461/g.12831  ORF Transcript_4461/g.12831 Transcript_4461/m.12831 type:complete len:267 (+) Transcript_4461:121-921(+)